jgi:hypothetical protein
MPSQRQTLLEAVISDPHSTLAEKDAARLQLNETTGDHKTVDRELAAYFDMQDRSRYESAQKWNHLSPVAKQAATDILDMLTFAMRPDPQIEARLRALRSTNETVQNLITRALSYIHWRKERNEYDAA